MIKTKLIVKVETRMTIKVNVGNARGKIMMIKMSKTVKGLMAISVK